MGSYPGPSSARGLSKSQLGGVIFGCKQTTINECLCKKLFGLPSSHYMYVKNIEPGLPVFLFNYTDRTLLGIFEAVSSGRKNIDPCAWSCDGSHLTAFPAQVQIRVKLQCKVLTENQYKPIIIANYYAPQHFWFELDHAQTNRLLSLMASQALSCPWTPIPPHKSTKQTTFFQPGEVNNTHLKNTKSLTFSTRQVNTFHTLTEKDVICMRLKELALKRKPTAQKTLSNESYVGPKVVVPAPLSAECEDKFVLNNNEVKKKGATNDPMWIETFKGLMAFNTVQKDTIELLKASNAAQKHTIDGLKQKNAFLEKNLVCFSIVNES
ncbi:uncharacterized protein LOC143547173 [Bidens hawaiensis]|uniref:uncharacterized protein LOC143547173 n=1 Tax=Bidens hawaiensis TaxID=980011 RepID=UPI00404B1EFD